MASDVSPKASGPLWKPEKKSKHLPHLLKRTSLKKVVDQLWVMTRNDWLDLNPPDENGNYQCALCPYWVHVDEVTLEGKPKSVRNYLAIAILVVL